MQINSKLMGTTLYSSADGNNTTITLSDAYTNYSTLKIYFYCNSNKVAYFIQEIDATKGHFHLMGFYKASDYVGQLVSEKWQLSGNTISYVDNARANMNTTWGSSQITMGSKDIYIYKVIGIK